MKAGIQSIPQGPEYRETLLDGVDHIEVYVGNACQAAHFHPVHHTALHTGAIVETVGRLRQQGAEFLAAPKAYYDTLGDRGGDIDQDLEGRSQLDILVNRDEHGHLLQIFTRPAEDHPTLFFDVIQRKGCRGFGKGLRTVARMVSCNERR